MLQGLVEVLRNRRLRPILALNFCNYDCTFTVQGLWGGPFLREVHGLSPIEAGNVLLAAGHSHPRDRLLQRLLDHGDDAWPWYLSGPADRARGGDHQYLRDVRRR